MKKPKQKRFYYDERPYYHDDERPYSRYRTRERRGFWYRLKRFLYGTLITLIVLSLAMLIIGVVILIYAYRSYISAYMGIAIKVLLGIGGVLFALLLLRVMIAILRPVFNGISEMRIRASRARKARIDASMDNVQLAREKVVLSQEKRESRQPSPRPQTRQIQSSQPATLPFQSQELVRMLPKHTVPLQAPKNAVPGMPPMNAVPYRDVQRYVKPGQVVALIRADGSPRIEAWEAFRVLLVLGTSASGKTSTMAEKILGFVSGGGLLIPCDAHEQKDDSLFNKIAPLAPALYPGAVFAAEHRAIMQNILLAAALLEDRVRGADRRVPVLLVIEELNRLLRDKTITKKIAVILETLGEEGRGFNIFVMVGCQRVTYLADIRKSFISYLVHRVDETESRHVIPARCAKYSQELHNGQCFLKDSNGVVEPGLQVLVTRQDIEMVARRLPQRPGTQRRTTVGLDLHGQQQETPQRPPLRLPGPSAPLPRQPVPPMQQSRPLVRRTRFQPDLRDTEELFNRGANWSGPLQEAPTEDLAHLFDRPAPRPAPSPRKTAPQQPAQRTEQFLESLSPDAQLELLARMRKKTKNLKEEF